MFVGKSSRQARLVTTARTAGRMPPACCVWTASPTVSIRTTGIGCPPVREVVTVTVGMSRPSNISQGISSLSLIIIRILEYLFRCKKHDLGEDLKQSPSEVLARFPEGET